LTGLDFLISRKLIDEPIPLPLELDGIEWGQKPFNMEKVITIDDEMHDIKGKGTLKEWNSGRMGFSKIS
jgi:hypothetical protein